MKARHASPTAQPAIGDVATALLAALLFFAMAPCGAAEASPPPVGERVRDSAEHVGEPP